MITEMRLPRLGQTMEEGKIVAWKKNEGDRIKQGDVLCEIETDKAVLDVESEGQGIVRKMFVQVGDTVPVNALIAVIAEAQEDISGIVA